MSRPERECIETRVTLHRLSLGSCHPSYATSGYIQPDQAILQGGAKPQLWDIRQIEYDGQPETQLMWGVRFLSSVPIYWFNLLKPSIQLPATGYCFSVWDNNSAVSQVDVAQFAQAYRGDISQTQGWFICSTGQFSPLNLASIGRTLSEVWSSYWY